MTPTGKSPVLTPYKKNVSQTIDSHYMDYEAQNDSDLLFPFDSTPSSKNNSSNDEDRKQDDDCDTMVWSVSGSSLSEPSESSNVTRGWQTLSKATVSHRPKQNSSEVRKSNDYCTSHRPRASSPRELFARFARLSLHKSTAPTRLHRISDLSSGDVFSTYNNYEYYTGPRPSDYYPARCSLCVCSRHAARAHNLSDVIDQLWLRDSPLSEDMFDTSSDEEDELDSRDRSDAH